LWLLLNKLVNGSRLSSRDAFTHLAAAVRCGRQVVDIRRSPNSVQSQAAG